MTKEEEQALQIVGIIDTERKLRGWNYNKTAIKSGLTASCVIQVLGSRTRTPNILTVLKLADALGLTVEVRR